MKVGQKPSAPPQVANRKGSGADDELSQRVFAGFFGAFLGLSLLKFGNPPIMEKWVDHPEGFVEFIFQYPWPIGWAYGMLVVAGVIAAGRRRWNVGGPKWLLALPLAWFIWEFIAGAQSVEWDYTKPTLKHFAACVGCFYLGVFSLSGIRKTGLFWLGITCGFLLVLATGLEQHFGGLKETRRYFLTYVYPQMKEVPPGYLQKISSERIFGTLFYPNALAGAILLLLPPILAVLWGLRERFTEGARRVLVGIVAVGGLSCLFWSGSKGGWLLALLMGLVVLLRLKFRRALKIGLIFGVLVLGLTGFFARYLGYFHKGATSVSARFDYWQAAVQITKEHPIFGTGPGTFFIPYQKIKRPESEPSRLTHNDYLEQASDSGIPGLLLYTGVVAGGLAWIARRKEFLNNWQNFAIWLGVLGWALQSLMEFALYIPALSWSAFAFLGWMVGKAEAGSAQAEGRESI
jgi:O-antigen ligase